MTINFPKQKFMTNIKNVLLNRFLDTVRHQVGRPVVLKVTVKSLWWVTSLLLVSPVVGLPTFSLWTGAFCSISFANAVTRSPEPH
jgi:hypothetical protein